MKISKCRNIKHIDTLSPKCDKRQRNTYPIKRTTDLHSQTEIYEKRDTQKILYET